MRWFLLVCILIFPANAFAAKLVLKVDGIPGESQLKGYEDQIEVLSLDWGVAPTETRRPVFCPTQLSVTKLLDSVSPALAFAALSRPLITEARLAAVRPVREDYFEYLAITLKNVRVDHYKVGGSEGTDPALESVGFSFSEISMIYTLTDALGHPVGEKTFTYQGQKPCVGILGRFPN